MALSLKTRLDALLVCAADALTAAGRPVPARSYIAPGNEVAWDDCCDGQLWARVYVAHPVNPFPTKILTLRPCGYPLAARIGLGILRCVTGLDNELTPSAEDLQADAEGMLCDQAALHAALCDCFQGADDAWALDQWLPLGPSGGCVGGEWTAFIEVRLDCPEEATP